MMMDQNAQKKVNLGLLILRVGIGILFIMHGYPKLMGGVEKWTELGGVMAMFGLGFAPTFWGFMAAASEAVGGLLLILGILFRPACLLMLATMVVAFAVHFFNADPFAVLAHPMKAAIVFAALFLSGPGEWTVLSLFRKRTKMFEGRVKKLVRNKGFGFIYTSDGREIFFHQNGLNGTTFQSLREGQKVVFEIKSSPKGANAVNISTL